MRPEDHKAQQKLSSMLSSTQIMPHPSCPIHQLTHQGHTVFVIEVTPFAVPPVVKVNGTAWIRQGTVTQRASDSDLRRLEERRPIHLQPFDVRPVRAAWARLTLTAVSRRSSTRSMRPPLERALTIGEGTTPIVSISWTCSPIAIEWIGRLREQYRTHLG